MKVRMFERALKSFNYLGIELPLDDDLILDHQVVIVESDGTIMPEESLRPTYNGRYADLNIRDVTPGKINDHPKFLQLVKAQKTISQDCLGCALLSACRGGMALGRIGMRIDESGSSKSKPVYCQSYIHLYAAIAGVKDKFGHSTNEHLESYDAPSAI